MPHHPLYELDDTIVRTIASVIEEAIEQPKYGYFVGRKTGYFSALQLILGYHDAEKVIDAAEKLVAARAEARKVVAR